MIIPLNQRQPSDYLTQEPHCQTPSQSSIEIMSLSDFMHSHTKRHLEVEFVAVKVSLLWHTVLSMTHA